MGLPVEEAAVVLKEVQAEKLTALYGTKSLLLSYPQGMVFGWALSDTNSEHIHTSKCRSMHAKAEVILDRMCVI